MGLSEGDLGPFVQYRKIWRKGPLQTRFIGPVRRPWRPLEPFEQAGVQKAGNGLSTGFCAVFGSISGIWRPASRWNAVDGSGPERLGNPPIQDGVRSNRAGNPLIQGEHSRKTVCFQAIPAISAERNR